VSTKSKFRVAAVLFALALSTGAANAAPNRGQGQGVFDRIAQIVAKIRQGIIHTLDDPTFPKP
jgi:hypothetical protein